jgi:phage baseplate assembly protein V
MHTGTDSRLSNQLRLGTIAEVDLAQARCRVQTGELVTDFLPWFVVAAGNLITWSAPRAGEQVFVLSPEGDTVGGVVLRGLYSDAFPAPSASADEHLVRFPDGAVIRYDSAAHQLQAQLPGGGKAQITASGGVTIDGPVTINGDVTVNGKVTSSTDVIGAGISLKGHKHLQVTPGNGVSGLPQ